MVGNPHRAQISQFELFELILLLQLDKQFSVERFEPTVSQSTEPFPLLGSEYNDTYNNNNNSNTNSNRNISIKRHILKHRLPELQRWVPCPSMSVQTAQMYQFDVSSL